MTSPLTVCFLIALVVFCALLNMELNNACYYSRYACNTLNVVVDGELIPS